ncbi:hypothetical protein [Paracraurococcus ruber]|nr:hypothetical protein [Paracraurococcus ruber]
MAGDAAMIGQVARMALVVAALLGALSLVGLAQPPPLLTPFGILHR